MARITTTLTAWCEYEGCYFWIYLDAIKLASAKKELKQKGWKIKKNKLICPQCSKKNNIN